MVVALNIKLAPVAIPSHNANYGGGPTRDRDDEWIRSFVAGRLLVLGMESSRPDGNIDTAEAAFLWTGSTLIGAEPAGFGEHHTVTTDRRVVVDLAGHAVAGIDRLAGRAHLRVDRGRPEVTPASSLFAGVVFVHVVTGFVGLAAFWVPVFARKGGRVHKQAGRVYAYCAYVVTISAVTAAAGRIASYRIDGIGVADQPELYGFAWLLAYLGVVTFAQVRHAIRVVATRRAPETLRTPFHEALAWASMAGSAAVAAAAVAAWSVASPVLLGLSPIGLFTGWQMLRMVRRPRAERMGWLYSHLGSMLGGGIAFHTAFLVFGAQRFWDYGIEGPLAVVPWILPTVVGVPAIVVWTQRYRRRFA